MTQINLLPWRDELRKQRQEQFIVGVAGVAIVAVVILFTAQMYLDGRLEEQQDKKRIVIAKTAELNLITAKIKDIQAKNLILQNKREAIQALQKSRPEVVHFVDEIAKVTPEGVYLTQIKQTDNQVILNGKTQSNARVSAFMRNVEASHWLIDPVLNIIRGTTGGKLSDFTLHTKQWKSKTEDEGM